MRNKLIGLVIAGLVVSAAGYAVASPQFVQTADVKLGTGKTARSTGVTATLTASDPGAVPPGNLKAAHNVTIQLPRGTKTNTVAAPQCSDEQLAAFVCPGDSRIGTGNATASALAQNGTPIISDVQTTITVYNMDGAIGFLIRANSLPITLPLKAELSKTGKLTSDLTRVPSPLRGAKVVLTSFHVKLERRSKKVGGKLVALLQTPKRCPAGGWVTTSSFSYEDGSTAQVTSKQRCVKPKPKKRRR